MSRHLLDPERPRAAVSESSASPPAAFPIVAARPGPLPQIPDQVLQFAEDALHRYLPGSPPGFLRQAIQQYQQGGQGTPAGQDPTPRLLTADEVRTVLGSISAMTLHRLMKGGALPVVRISGRRIGFDPEDVRAFIASRKTGTRRGRGRAGA